MGDTSEDTAAKPGSGVIEKKAFQRISRRELLKVSPVLVAGALFIPKVSDSIVTAGVKLSDGVSHSLFRQHHLARTFADSDAAPLDKFPYNYYDELDPEIDLAAWSLTVSGLVKKPGEYKLAQVQTLPKVVQNTRHVCVEGWSVIGNFGGVRISDFLTMIGADPSARFLEVECADDYYESIDIEAALHPQSLLCYEMYGEPLDRGHGAPLRLQMPTKLGYKQAKYLTSLKVSNVLSGRKGYWEDQGYSWHGGL